MLHLLFEAHFHLILGSNKAWKKNKDKSQILDFTRFSDLSLLYGMGTRPPVNDAKPYLNLVHPGTVFRSIDKAEPVGRVMQEIHPAFHTFKDPCFPFLPSSMPGAQASAT